MNATAQIQADPTLKPSSTPVGSNLLQRKCACGGTPGPSGECAECRSKRLALQRRASHQAEPSSVPPIVHEVLRSPGRPLDPATRAFVEPRLGHDFGGVRVHTDAKAAESAGAVNALAYTVKQDVVFGAGQYAPETGEGRRLLLHELTHVLQQRDRASGQDSSLQIGPIDDAHERAAVEAGKNWDQAPVPAPTHSPMLQRDLARQPSGPGAPVLTLTAVEVAEAIAFNEARFSDPYSIRVIRDVLGLEPVPAIVDEALIQAVVEWQAARSETQDGKIGHTTTRSIVLELIAEDKRRDAVVLILDSYALLTSRRLGDIRVGTGANCCGTAANPADAVTFGGVCPPVGGSVRVCVCRTSFPPAVGYNHFVRIVGHEMIHVPHCAGAALDLHATEFEAFFFEACAEGRARRLTATQRVNHANIALAHFAALAPAARTPARITMRDQLNALVAAGGTGPC